MNIFKNYTFTWWQVGLLKACVMFVGIAIGAHWPEVFAQYIKCLLVVAVVLGLYLWYISFKK